MQRMYTFGLNRSLLTLGAQRVFLPYENMVLSSTSYWLCFLAPELMAVLRFQWALGYKSPHIPDA